MPTLYVIAGPNGCGKSTLTRMSGFGGLEIIDPDRVMLDLRCNTSFEAGREALHLRQTALDEGRSHVVETTLSGSSVLRHMKKARTRGYRVILHYVCVDSPEQSLDRIRNRVVLGGHDVPAVDVRRRFNRSLNNLPSAILLVDEVEFYDNSDPDHPHRDIAIYKAGRLMVKDTIPDWIHTILTLAVR